MVGVESAAMSAAVSGTLNLVCNKLAPLVIKEYSSIVGVEKDLQELQDLAKEINRRLEEAGGRAIVDAPFLKKLKEVVYEVEDVVDEFQLKAEKYEADGEGGFLSKHLLKKPKSFVFQCQAAKKIKKIKNMLDVLVKQNTVLNSVAGHGVLSHVEDIAVKMQTLAIVDKAKVIGRNQQMDDIISELLQDDDQQRIKIVSIVGLGGSGKTTLAQMVFNEVKEKNNNHFLVKLWVHVSEEEFQLEKILKKLFDAISNERSDGLSLRYMANKISDELTNKRFLLVMDDVWNKNRIKWAEFLAHLKNGSPGSRILLTTREKDVAKASESTKVIDLPLLSESDSWEVFQQSYGNAMEHDFEDVGKEIVNKCGGVPLAIKVIAGVLRDKKRVEQWHAIKDNNLLNVDSKEHQVLACLWLSYFNLPSHLKKCFTICSIFPKGHFMDKHQLIDKWIAHDMVKEDCVNYQDYGVNYLEYIGEDCFSYLVQMCFIQDVKEIWDGRVICKMHDLVYDLARSILCDEISYAMPKKATNCTEVSRYFSITEKTRHLLHKNIFKKARAMYISQYDDFIFGKAFKKAKYLRSITAEYVQTSALTTILQAKNLRYLAIHCWNHETLPESISDIWCLQALHVTSSELVKLPESIDKLQKLRVVNLSGCWRLTSLPDSIGNCVMISRIDIFNCGKIATLPSSISRNKRLRVLKIGRTVLERLPSSITTLENLECLDLQHCSELVELPEGIGNLKKLVVLNLKGCEKLLGIPKGIAQLTRLETLGLFVIGEDDENYAKISELENINKLSGELTIHGIAPCMDTDFALAHKEWLKQKTNLQSLTLICASDAGVNSRNQLEGLEPPPAIKNLKIVRYSGQKSTHWMFCFRLLRELVLSHFPKLERLEGLTELPCLEKLVLDELTSLKSISGGPFLSLSELSMDGMPSLGVVWMVTEGSMGDVEGGKVQIGNRLSALTILYCPNLIVMPYFPRSLKKLSLVKSNMQLLGLPGIGQGLSCFSFSCLKNLKLESMPPPALEMSNGSGCKWELLQHLTALEDLTIESCNDLTELPKSMRSLAALRSLTIRWCSAPCMLPEWLGELRYLQAMYIWCCGTLSSAPSMQPLRALKELHITHTEAHPLIEECLGELRSLQILKITGLQGLSSLPQSLGYLTSLQDLRIYDCQALGQIPDCAGELCSLHVFQIWGLPSLTSLPQSLGRLTSLQKLDIGICDALGQLPESLGELRSLKELEIWHLPGLTSIPESMCRLTSVEHLTISNCLGIRSIPEGIKGLTALQTLVIWDCPDLERRCKRRKGQDWHLISHIPHLQIG